MSTYAGKPTCTCGAKWLPAYVARLATFGISVRFTQLIGSYGASAGTHGGGLCFDLVVVQTGKRSLNEAYKIVVREARLMGADATWERPYNWDRRGGIRHVHGLGTGCPHLKAAAKNQQTAVRNGRNGLANNATDPGPRPLSGRTWSQGITWATSQKEDDMPLTDADVKKIVTALKKDLFSADVVKIEDPVGTPESRKANPTWAIKSVLGVLLREVVRTRDMVAQLLEEKAGPTGKA